MSVCCCPGGRRRRPSIPTLLYEYQEATTTITRRFIERHPPMCMPPPLPPFWSNRIRNKKTNHGIQSTIMTGPTTLGIPRPTQVTRRKRPRRRTTTTSVVTVNTRAPKSFGERCDPIYGRPWILLIYPRRRTTPRGVENDGWPPVT